MHHPLVAPCPITAAVPCCGEATAAAAHLLAVAAAMIPAAKCSRWPQPRPASRIRCLIRICTAMVGLRRLYQYNSASMTAFLVYTDAGQSSRETYTALEQGCHGVGRYSAKNQPQSEAAVEGERQRAQGDSVCQTVGKRARLACHWHATPLFLSPQPGQCFWRCGSLSQSFCNRVQGKIPWNKGRKMTEEERAKISAGHRNKTHCKTTKLKMSRSHMGMRQTEVCSCHAACLLHCNTRVLKHSRNVI